MTTLESLLQWVQIAVSILTLAGVAFAVGRLVERVEALERLMREMRDTFGASGDEGVFLRRSEAQLMQETAVREHAAFDVRLDDVSRRVGALEHSRRHR